MKKILILSQAISQTYIDTIKSAVGNDGDIEVITGSDLEGNIIKAPKHANKSLKARLICWMKYYKFVCKWLKNVKKEEYDLVFATSNPPINSYLGLKIKRKLKIPFIYMNWDLYPQVIEVSIKNKVAQIICKLWHNWNSQNYRKIDKMVTIGEVMSETINSGLKKKIDIEVIPITVDVDYLKPIEKKDNNFCLEHGISDKFIVLYSGKMGLGHNVEMVLEATEKLRDYSDIQFVFIGHGEKYPVIEKFIAEHNCKNILLLPLQPKDIFPYSMASGDVAIVTQESKMAHMFMPSRSYSMMSCGDAIIGISTNNDDLYRLISKNQIGETVTDNLVDTLVEKIKELYSNPKKLKEYQLNARKIAEEQYACKVIEEKYKKLFENYL